MRHHKSGRKLGRDANERKALFRSLAISLVRYDSVVTTGAKAAALRPMVEKLVTRAKEGTIAASRSVQAMLGNKELGKKFIKDIVPVFTQTGGFTSVARIRDRRGDGATLVRVSWFGFPKVFKEKPQPVKKDTAPKETVKKVEKQ